MALGVLRARIAQLSADAHEDRRPLEHRVALHWQAPRQRDAAAVQEVLAQRGRVWCQPRQRKLRRGQPADAGDRIAGLREDRTQLGVQFGEVARRWHRFRASGRQRLLDRLPQH
ncbi:MAG: hypothetical protein ACK54C_14980, partial [Betaproteobacteria bacterium]